MRNLKPSYDPIEVERKVSEMWVKNRIRDKLSKLRETGPLFRFLEGPPTANGFMHIGHARGRAMKDAVLRFEAMRGKNVWRKAGWDCQGLPVEIEAEKNLGIKSKGDLEKIGLSRFVEECSRLVDFYIQHWRKNSERLGLWLDYDHAYETRKDKYIEFVWWFIKKAYEKGLLKEDYKVVPTCPRCETPLSSHEVSLGYATLRDPSIIVKFQLEDKPGEYILIWTTTPWTLVGNEAVSVHPDHTYVKVKVGEEVWILAEELRSRVFQQLKVEDYVKVDSFNGRKLEGAKYVHPLMEETPAHRRHSNLHDHAVICGEHVSMEEGTGCVHTAPAHGPEDFEVGARYGIPVFCPVDQKGLFTGEAGKYGGIFFREANKAVVEDLKRKELLVWSGEIEHEYPTCWRCGTPLLYRADKQWFLQVSLLRERMLGENSSVQWFPEWAGRNRFGEWLCNAEDWCISRTRVWGSPLNVWKCGKCEALKVIGTREELVKEAKKLPSRLELHRPWIDEVVLKCPRCGEEMSRVPFVLDCWLDSGVAHSASINALEDPQLFQRLYPYDFITEAVDQTRGWFYSLLATGVTLYDKTPYVKVLCQGHVLDKYGQKMSKSKGNVIWTEEILNLYGADVTRFYLLGKAAPEDTLLFDVEELSQVKRVLNVVWNVFAFAVTYMQLDRFNPEDWPLEKIWKQLKDEDRWLLSRCQSMTGKVTENLVNFRLHKALREVFDFLVEDVSRFYLRLIRRRTWIEAEAVEKMTAYTALYTVLLEALKLMSPFTPYLAEELYSALSPGKPESIHLCSWPERKNELVDETLERDIQICREALKAVLAARQKGRIKLRWPVRTVTLLPSDQAAHEAFTRRKEILLNQANAKEVLILRPGERPPFLKLKLQPQHASLGLKFKSAFPKVLAGLEKMGEGTALQLLQEKGEVEVSVEGETYKLQKEDFKVEEIYPSSIVAENFDHGRVYVDTAKTPELLAESAAREIVRRAQLMRKDMQLNIEDYVDATLGYASSETLSILKQMEDYIKTEVRIRNLRLKNIENVKPAGEGAYLKEWLVGEEKIKILLERIRS
ncbi:isoleucine--tRNA ligase [Candidatus Hecatella orcuttiae]|jgi:isoleucyl-tRNA synthetase|uniref:isoleucine--tRNA ligase n=1 Tax=Candidatus Hecatella orcuttiae TaxID=1935119 RepID=UPI0028681DC6|nr:isoleucine--tRNA ligase [Candidatus Hecatella orcuttiae]